MSADGKLMEMLTGYAAAHQHPANIFVHMVGIPTIMLGVLIPLTWVGTDFMGWPINLGHLLIAGFFVFYLTLDRVFALVFLVMAVLLAELARVIGSMPRTEALSIAAVAFGGGYALQFVGHAIEKSMPVLVRNPIQANLAAPFFTVVEGFKLLGLRDELFQAVQNEVAVRQNQSASRPGPASTKRPD